MSDQELPVAELVEDEPKEEAPARAEASPVARRVVSSSDRGSAGQRGQYQRSSMGVGKPASKSVAAKPGDNNPKSPPAAAPRQAPAPPPPEPAGPEGVGMDSNRAPEATTEAPLEREQPREPEQAQAQEPSSTVEEEGAEENAGSDQVAYSHHPEALEAANNGEPYPLADFDGNGDLEADPVAPALAEHSNIFVWGANSYGCLGLGHYSHVTSPIEVESLSESSVREVACGGQHLILLTSDGGIYVSGKNDRNQLGMDTVDERQSVPILLDWPFGAAPSVSQIVCGYDHTVMLTTEGFVFAFGTNAKAELGLGHEDPVAGPALVDGIRHKRVVQVSTKGYHTLALTEDDEVFAWGENSLGQCGLGHTDSPQAVPVSVPTLRGRGAELVVCGSFHSVVCVEGRQTLVFGDGGAGQLGLKDDSCRVVPTPCPALNGRRVAQVACGFGHTLVLLADQDICLASGLNSHGQLGLLHNEDQYSFCRVEAVCHRNLVQIACGYNSSFFWIDGDDPAASAGTVEEEGDHNQQQGEPDEAASPSSPSAHRPPFDDGGPGLFACGASTHGVLGVGAGVEDQWRPTLVRGVPRRLEGRIFASSFCVVLPGRSARTNKRFQPTLSTDMAGLLASREMCDVMLQAAGDGAVFSAHRSILSCRCRRIGQLIDDAARGRRKIGVVGDEADPIFVALPQLIARTLQRLLLFLYSGIVEIHDASISDILLLASAAQDYQIGRLQCLCEEEIELLLTDENVVLVLREARDLNLLVVKRLCMEYVTENYSGAVSSRNRSVVEALGNAPELLAEVVGLSSPDFADACINSLPPSPPCPASSLEFDMQLLFHSGDHADIVMMATGDEVQSELGPGAHGVQEHHGMPGAAALGSGGGGFFRGGGWWSPGGVTRSAPEDGRVLGVGVTAAAPSGSAPSSSASSSSGAAAASPRRKQPLERSSSGSAEHSGGGASGAGKEHHHAGLAAGASDSVESTHQQPHVSPFMLAHRVVLAARSPFFAEMFRAYLKLKEEGHNSDVDEDTRERVKQTFAGADDEGRLIVREANESSPQALRAFLIYLYTDSTLHVRPEHANDVLQLACVYGLGEGRLATECEKLLRIHMKPHSALETLCVAHQLARDDLKQTTLNYILDHFVDCVEDDEDMLNDAVCDFPELGVELLQHVASRLRRKGIGHLLRLGWGRDSPMVGPGVSGHGSPTGSALHANGGAPTWGAGGTLEPDRKRRS